MSASASASASAAQAQSVTTPVPAPAPSIQPATGTGPAKTGTGKVEEVVVTARRRSESLAHVPLSVTALSSKELAQRHVTTESDLQRGVPGLTIRTGQTDNSLTFTIRGQGIDTFSASRPAVLTYFNEVPLASFSASTFYDLSSIQVLKGPQGTLFGRNTTGGAVLYTSARPTDQLDGYISSEFGNYAEEKYQGAVNIPIVPDKVLLRLAGNIETRDGWQHNVTSGQDQGAVDDKSGRATLTIRPFDGFESTTLGGYTHTGGNNIDLEAYAVSGCGETRNGVLLAVAAAACLYGPAFPYYNIYREATPGATPEGIVGQVALQQALGLRQVNSPVGDFHDGNDFIIMNTSSYEIDPDLTLKNIVSYVRPMTNDLYDSFGTGPYRVGTLESQPGSKAENLNSYTQETKSVTEEVQASGKALSGALTYLVGGFFSFQQDYYRAPFAFFDLRPIAPPVYSVNESVTKDNSQAIYAQSTLDLSNWVLKGLKLTGGVRYTWEQVELDRLPLSTQPGEAQEQTSFRDPSWTVGLDYQITPQLLLYVVQRGSFRAGGFNNTGLYLNTTSAQGGNLFLPEKVHDVEVGAKYSGQLGGMPVRANIALYDSEITDVQRALFTFLPASVTGTGSTELATVTVNIPSARVRGVEFGGAVNPLRWLELGAAVTYTDAEYTDGRSESFGTTYNYGPYADTPVWTGDAYAGFAIPLGDRYGNLTARTDFYAQTSQYFSNLADTLTPGTKLPGYGLLNASVTWAHVYRSQFDVSAFITNALQKDYYTGGFSFPPLGISSVIPGAPRFFGGSVRYSF